MKPSHDQGQVKTDDALEWSAAEHAIFYPPWSEQGLMYGPMTASEYTRVMHEHGNERYGAVCSASLWDPAEERPKRVRPSSVPRKDADLFERRIPVLLASIPRRELQAATFFWMARKSFGVIARTMGVTRATVRTWISRTRARMHRVDG